MTKLYVDGDRYGEAPASVLVEAVHNSVRDLVRRRLGESGHDWGKFVFESANDLITKSDFEAIENRILATGHRFAWSSMLSLRDRPEIYARADQADDVGASFSFDHPEAAFLPADGMGRELHGVGDNVVRHGANTIGVTGYIRTSERVIDLMKNGVPPDLIAIIDDSGGTLTAPILDKFKGVICAGGTVRSHLGILTREYGIPCLMNVKISGIREGDRIELETSATAKTAEAYQRGEEMTARIWKLLR
ncbi:MAG TPA: PEP-utilizing enzyme [Steroidobacteraceae bacterium]|jgi:phosphohistidine swiveling domain-containing protein